MNPVLFTRHKSLINRQNCVFSVTPKEAPIIRISKEKTTATH
jgi:hypothetical protein